ncbi:MAG: diaminopimelate decarboxylase [Acidobacteria bacterium]|nr:diaminopimelate decarboxylase [Acidobacteriota bacterium]
MSAFTRRDGSLWCDEVPIAEIVGDAGSPLYIYSAAGIRGAFTALDTALAGSRHTLHYALKANSTRAVLRLLRQLGAHADANSGGEIEAARRAGFEPAEIVFTGVGKTRDELDHAVALGVKAINIESDGEARRIDDLARARGVKARVALRVNPDIDPNTHAKISTGQRFNKFGVPIEYALTLLRDMARRPGLDPVGLHVHLGSQLVELDPIVRAAHALAELARQAKDAGVRLRHLDLGGGLGIAYDGASPPDPVRYAEAIAPIVKATGLDLLLEPGRYLVGSAGILVGRVADLKSYPGSPRFMVLDTGMTELIRPALYGAYHRIEAVTPRAGDELVYEVVGPLCETSDTLGHDRSFGPVEVGDLIAIFDAGAYGIVMASNYNRRRFPAEVLVDQGRWEIISRRQSYDDLMAREV